MTFGQPLWLLLLLVLAPLSYLRFRSLKLINIPVPSIDFLEVHDSWWIRARHIPVIFRMITLAAIAAASAEPFLSQATVRDSRRGVSIELLVDCSGSMGMIDFDSGPKPSSRLDAVKRELHRFLLDDRDRLRRPSDEIGLITFAEFPETLCPLIFDHRVLAGFADSIDVRPVGEDGTNIADAIVWGLHELSQSVAGARAIVVLSDGSNEPVIHKDSPPIELNQAIELVKEANVPLFVVDLNSEPSELSKVAESTGGLSFRASDPRDLAVVMTSLNELTRADLFEERTKTNIPLTFWFIVVALVALSSELVIRNTRLGARP